MFSPSEGANRLEGDIYANKSVIAAKACFTSPQTAEKEAELHKVIGNCSRDDIFPLMLLQLQLNHDADFEPYNPERKRMLNRFRDHLFRLCGEEP